MRLERLKLRNYRNIRELELFPDPGINVIYGDNAQGKTNLIEAIYLFTGQKSFRPCKESDLVQLGEKSALLEADFYSGGRSQQATLAMGNKKTATLNELPVTPTELTGRFFAVVFSPAELSLVQDGPSVRRGFLDAAISQVMPRYLKTLASMNRALFQRNSLLTDLRRYPELADTLDSWDRSFAKLSFSVILARRRYISRLSPHVSQVYGGIASGKESLTAAYQSSFGVDWDGLNTQQCEEAILDLLQQSRGEDIKNGFTTLGPQRDDLELFIDGAAARSFGSQGQQRSCALALKLAECTLIQEICGEEPIVLLDDVFSELDKSRRDFFVQGIEQGQIFITSCERTGLRGFSVGKKFHIKNGAVAAKRGKKASQ